eukprot:s6562_g4.t1
MSHHSIRPLAEGVPDRFTFQDFSLIWTTCSSKLGLDAWAAPRIVSKRASQPSCLLGEYGGLRSQLLPLIYEFVRQPILHGLE